MAGVRMRIPFLWRMKRLSGNCVLGMPLCGGGSSIRRKFLIGPATKLETTNRRKGLDFIFYNTLIFFIFSLLRSLQKCDTSFFSIFQPFISPKSHFTHKLFYLRTKPKLLLSYHMYSSFYHLFFVLFYRQISIWFSFDLLFDILLE